MDADLVALDVGTGYEVWRTHVEAHAADPVTEANDVLFVADDSGRIAAYDGRRLWAHEVAVPAAGGIAVVDGVAHGVTGGDFSSHPPGPVGGLEAFAPGAEGLGTGDSDSSEEAASGEDAYRRSCASCHGGGGEGRRRPVTGRRGRPAHA